MERKISSTGFVEKFIEAKKMEKEAFMMLIPDYMKEHLAVIDKEIKSMLKEGFSGAPSDSGEAGTKSKVKKVDIG